MNVTGALGRLLRSPSLAVGLLLAIALMAAAGSLLAAERLFSHPVFTATVLLAALNVAVCTWHRLGAAGARRLVTARRASDLLLHASLILVLAGAAAKGALGSIKTKNVAVGTETGVMFDWREGREVPLGFSLRVEEFREERFPARVRLGVRETGSGRKVALLSLVEGEPSRVPGADIVLRVAGYDPPSGTILVRAVAAGREERLLFATREGGDTTRASGGYTYFLTAWRSDVRSARARVILTEGAETVAEGWLQPNGRLRHRGTSLFLTAWGNDDFGNPFCGIQAVRDPAAPVFWTGCILLSFSVAWHLALKGRLGAPTLEQRRNPG